MITDNIKNDILDKSEVFFNSINTQFRYREKNLWKFNAVRGTSFVFILFAVFSIIPIIPLTLASELEFITNKYITVWSYNLSLKNNYIRWAVFAIFSFSLAFIFSKIENVTNNLENKKSINYRHLKFAFLFKSIYELKVFLINERIEHSEISILYLRKYFELNFVNYDLKIAKEYKTINLPETLINIQKNNPWLKFADDSNEIIHAFANSEKLFIRINQRIEIDTLILILEEVLCYEYISLHKAKFEQNNVDNENSLNIRIKFLLKASQKILELPMIEAIPSNSQKTTSVNRLKAFLTKIGEFFTNENFFITFISWFLFLTLIFVLFIFFGIRAFSIQIDTTIYIGVVSGIILGAITVATSLHSKKK